MSQRSVTIHVAGHSLNLRTDQDDDALHDLAKLVTAHVDRVQHGARTVSTHRVYLLAALTIAEELRRERTERERLAHLVTQRATRALELLDEHGDADTR